MQMLEILVAIMTLVVTCTFLGLIPWAFKVTSNIATIVARLVSIESELHRLTELTGPPQWLVQDVENSTKEIRDLWKEIHQIHMLCNQCKESNIQPPPTDTEE